MFQMMKGDKTSEVSEMEIGNLPNKWFIQMTAKMLKKLGRRQDVQSEKLEIFNKKLNIKKNKEMKSKIIEKHSRRSQQ